MTWRTRALALLPMAASLLLDATALAGPITIGTNVTSLPGDVVITNGETASPGDDVIVTATGQANAPRASSPPGMPCT